MAFRIAVFAWVLAASLLAPGLLRPAMAAGFYVQEQSAGGLGTAYAGSAADTPDASTIYYNPAGMTDLGQTQAYAGFHIISPSAHFTDKGSTAASTVGTGGAALPLAGGNGGQPFDAAGAPDAYLAFPASPDGKIWLGIAVSAPFGLQNKYEDNFTGRYDSTSSSLMTVDVAPSAAVQIRKWLSAGAGIDVQYAEAELQSAIPSPLTAGGPRPSTDGLQNLSGNDLGVGFNAGILIKPAAGTRLGLDYRQGIDHTMQGRVLTRVPGDIPVLGGSFSKTQATAGLNLPSILSAGFSQQITGSLKLLGQVTWFQWSDFHDIPVRLANGASTSILQNYKDTYAAALGLRYEANDRLSFKLGVQYDQTPTQDGFRSTRVPDGDRKWIAAGLTYGLNENLSLDVSGALIDVSHENINLAGSVPIGVLNTSYTIDGETKGRIGIVGAALRYKYDMPKHPAAAIGGTP